MKNAIPDTRNSLILRLPDKQDIEAWDWFVSIYDPVVFRLAISKGLQEADARDLVQEVMVAVARAVERWDPDQQRGRFRDWLFRIARNLILNFLVRTKNRPWSQGGSDHYELLQEQCDPDANLSGAFDLEFRRELFRVAAERVQKSVKQQTWDAFRMTYIEGRTTAEAAAALGTKEGVVHVARCRVLARLREMVRQLEHKNVPLAQQVDRHANQRS